MCVWPATKPTRAGCSTSGPGDQSLCQGNWMPAGGLRVSGTVEEQREKLVGARLYESLHDCLVFYIKDAAFHTFLVGCLLSQRARNQCTRTQIWPSVFCCHTLHSQCGPTSSTVTTPCGLCSPTSRVLWGREPTSTRRLSAGNRRICSRW